MCVFMYKAHLTSFYLFSTSLSTSERRTNSYLLAAEAFSYSLLKVLHKAVASSRSF
jgi:hypothetical protein